MNIKVLITVVACLFSSSLSAQALIGETPGGESVCNGLTDATPGLFGLCVAYCEAKNCDEAEYESKSCRKILDNYNRKMIIDIDPAMPCLSQPPECPCFTMEQVVAIAEKLPIADDSFCFNGPEPNNYIYQIIQVTVGVPFDPFHEWDARSWDSIWSEEVGCDYRDYAWDGETAQEIYVEWTSHASEEGREILKSCTDIVDLVWLTYELPFSQSGSCE